MTNSHGTICQEYPEPLQIIVEHCSCQEDVESKLFKFICICVSPELSPRFVSKNKKVLPDQQLNEQEQLCSSPEEEQVIVKQENNPVVLIPVCVENNHSDDII